MKLDLTQSDDVSYLALAGARMKNSVLCPRNSGLMRSGLIFLILFTVSTNLAHADYMDFHFKLNCDLEGGRAEISPYAIWNEIVRSDAPQDCSLPGGRTIRAKMGLGPVYPYGMGGADPSKWLSVWIDKALVLRRIQFDCGDEGPCNMRVVVTSEGFMVCRRKASEAFTSQDPPNAVAEHCEFTPNDKLLFVRDSLEFPAPNERVRPAAGSLVTLYAKDERFCNQFLLPSKFPYRASTGDNISAGVGLPENAEPVESQASSPYEYAGSYQHYTFDINNDGKKESVVGLHARTHYRDGDIYFVYPKGNVPSPQVERGGSTHSERSYAMAATRIIPHYWSDYAGEDEKRFVEEGLDGGAYEIKSVNAPWWDSNDKPIFGFRYWYLWPFRYKDSTYFLTWSQEASTQHWYTVLRPEANYHLTEMCVFQTVKIRY